MSVNLMWLQGFRRDLGHAARVLRRAPVFSATAVLSLGLGIALATATVAVANAYLVRSLPYPASTRLYSVLYARTGEPQPEGRETIDWTSLGDVVEIALASDPDVHYLTEGGYTQATPSSRVTAGFLEGLGVRPAIGRSFTAGDAADGAERVALISHDLWRSRFDSDPNVLGRRFRAYSAEDERATATFTIVGVLQAGFWMSRPTDIMLPLASGVVPAYTVRLRDGVPVALAERRITDETVRVATSVPAGWSGVRLRSLHEQYAADVRPIVIAVTAAAGLVLAIVCVNVAVLMMLRSTRRQREFVLRMALGAGRANVMRMLAAEAGLLSALSLVLGLGLTALTLRGLAPHIEQNLGRRVPGGASAVAIDGTVLLAMVAAGAFVATVLAVVPLLATWRTDLFSMLRRDGQGGAGGLSGRRLRSALTAAEIAGALALLVGCGLMVRTVVHLTRTDLGFNTEHLVRAAFTLPAEPYRDPPALLSFYDRLLGSLDPSASLTDWPMFAAPLAHPIEVDGTDTRDLRVAVLGVGGAYFQTFGVRIVAGRAFTTADRFGAEPVAIVSDTLARRLWPDGGAVGQRIRATEDVSYLAPLTSWRTIVGVAADVRQTFTDEDLRDVYLPFLQVPNRFASIYLKTDAPLASWLGQLRETVRSINAEVAVGAAPSLTSAADQLLAGPRFLASLMTGFAGFTALVALLGVYGVVTYSVQQREREIAIRIALGASRLGVTTMLVRHGAAIVTVGVAVGLVGASGVTRMLQTELHGVGSFDALTLTLTCVTIGAAGLLATWWPARRAASGNPVVILKGD